MAAGRIPVSRPRARLAAAASLTVLGLALTGCGNSGGSDAAPANRDPRIGWVTIEQIASYQGGIWKRCDSGTLVYVRGGSNGGMSVIPNSPECAP